MKQRKRDIKASTEEAKKQRTKQDQVSGGRGMGGHRACEPAEVLFELGGLYKSTNEQTINYLVFQLFNSSSGISTAEVLRRESNAMWWGIFHGHTYVFTLTHIYAHIYRFKHLTICTHTHTFLSACFPSTVIWHPSYQDSSSLDTLSFPAASGGFWLASVRPQTPQGQPVTDGTAYDSDSIQPIW